MSGSDPSTADQGTWSARAMIAAALALVLPGAGHVYLGRRGRAGAFAVILLVSALLGVLLSGNLYRVIPNQPLTLLGTMASMGMGVPYLLLRWAGYQGDIVAVGYEYGTAFLLTTGLMNWLLVLDCWDIAVGRKA